MQRSCHAARPSGLNSTAPQPIGFELRRIEWLPLRSRQRNPRRSPPRSPPSLRRRRRRKPLRTQGREEEREEGREAREESGCAQASCEEGARRKVAAKKAPRRKRLPRRPPGRKRPARKAARPEEPRPARKPAKKSVISRVVGEMASPAPPPGPAPSEHRRRRSGNGAWLTRLRRRWRRRSEELRRRAFGGASITRLQSLPMSFLQVDDDGHLLISPCSREGAAGGSRHRHRPRHGGGLDTCIPTAPGTCLYVYFPIFDEELPDQRGLTASGRIRRI